jgi:hypothetical protein
MPKNKQRDSDLSILPPKQARCVVALMAGGSVEEAAQKTGVVVRTVYAWLDIPQFRQALRQAQAGYIETAQSRLVSGQQAALLELESLMTSAQSESVRRAACVDWLGMMFKYREAGELEERIQALERAVTNG